jgi:transcriptional regulator with XRE-family HTH domain
MDMGSAERLGAAIHRRRQSLAMNVTRFAALVGVADQTLRDLEAGTHPRPQDDTLFKIDAAAQSPSGSCDRILSGELEDFPPLPTADDVELARRIAALDAGDVHLLGLLIERLSA